MSDYDRDGDYDTGPLYDYSYIAFPAESPDVYGQVLSARDVRQALLQTIQTWSADYIAEMASVTGLPMAQFGTWEATYEHRTVAPDLTAACWTTCTTTDPKHPPLRQGDGTYSAVWIADANLQIYGQDWAQAADLVAAYTAAVRAAVLQHGSLGGFASATRWLGEASKEIEHQALRTVQVAVISFAVTVEGAVNSLAGPKTPTDPATPGASGGPTVDQVDITITDFPADTGLPI